MSATARPKIGDGQKKVKWTRASVSKVKTGCLTCKKRHLKCDEEKPVCRRCKQDRRICDGYDPPNRARAQKPPPRNKPQNHSLQISIQSQFISAGVSGTQVEKFLFHHVKDCTIKDLGRSSLLVKFWHNYVLPLGHNVDSIKHALIAFGAAHRSFLLPGSHGFDSSKDHSYAKIAIQQYNRAIQHVTSVMSDPSPINIQITLVCCLIFVCFENLRGQYAEALRHLRAGSRLLNLRCHSATALSAGTSEQSTPSKVFAGTSSEFNQLCDIADMFSRLGLDASILVDDKVVPISELSFYSHPVYDEDVSRPFPSIDAAREQLDRIEKDFDLIWEPLEQQFNDACYGFSGAAGCGDCGSAEVWDWSEEDGLAYQALHNRFDIWVARFELYIDVLLRRTVSVQELNNAMVLVLHQRIWSATFKQGLNCNGKLEREDFESIVQQAELLAKSAPSPGHPIFTFDADLIPPLAFVCSFCKDNDLRQRAISLLRSMNRREGIWDSREMAEIFETTFVVEGHNVGLDGWAHGGILGLVRVLSRLGHLQHNTTSAVTLLAQSSEY